MISSLATEELHLTTLLGFGARIRQAVLDKASQIGRRYTTKEFAADVGNAERGRGKPYAPSMITEWVSERSEPGIAALAAMTKVTGKSLEWLTAYDLLMAASATPAPKSGDAPDERFRLAHETVQHEARRGRRMVEAEAARTRGGRKRR